MKMFTSRRICTNIQRTHKSERFVKSSEMNIISQPFFIFVKFTCDSHAVEGERKFNALNNTHSVFFCSAFYTFFSFILQRQRMKCRPGTFEVLPVFLRTFFILPNATYSNAIIRICRMSKLLLEMINKMHKHICTESILVIAIPYHLSYFFSFD